MGSKSKRKPAAPPPPSLTIGDLVHAQCRKCRQPTQHVVVRKVGWAPTFVTCQECETSHDFKVPRPVPVESEVTDRSAAEEWRAHMTGATPTRRPYDRTRRFDIGDFIQHPGFGDGVVVGCSSGTVCEVAFERGTIKLAMAKRPAREATGVGPKRG